MDIVPILSTIILVATLITLIVAVVSYLVFRIKERRREARAKAALERKKAERKAQVGKGEKARGSEAAGRDRRVVEAPEPAAAAGQSGIGRRATDPRQPAYTPQQQPLPQTAQQQATGDTPPAQERETTPAGQSGTSITVNPNFVVPGQAPSTQPQMPPPIQQEPERVPPVTAKKEAEPEKQEPEMVSPMDDEEDEVVLSDAQAAFIEAMNLPEQEIKSIGGGGPGEAARRRGEKAKLRRFTVNNEEKRQRFGGRDDEVDWK